MTEHDPLFDGGEDAELDRYTLLLAPLKTEAPPPPLPVQTPLWRRPAFQALAAALVLAVGAVVVTAGSDDDASGWILLAPGDEDPATGTAVVAEPTPPGLTADEVRALAERADPEAPSAPEDESSPEDESEADPEEGPSAFDDASARLALQPHVTREGSSPARLLFPSPEGNVHYPQLSPSGTRITYEVNYPAEKRTELWMAGLSNQRLSGEPTMLVPESMGSPSRYGGGKRITHMFGWAPEESEYAYAYTVNNADGQQQISIEGWPHLLTTGVNKEPTWDPTSPRFVFTSNRTGNGDLYLWDDGAELQLTFDETHAELYPSWAPAGDKITFVRAGKGESQVMLLDINLFSAAELVNFPGKDATRPSFSPEGDKVAFLSKEGQDSVMSFGLWVVDAKPGSTPRQIGAKVRIPSKGGPRWTPDGRGVIAVIDDREHGDPIAIFPVAADEPVVLLDTGTVRNRDPFLHVDGDRWLLAYTSQGAGDEKTWYSLYLYDIPH